MRHGAKISSLRLALYTLFGYAVSGAFSLKIYSIHFAIILGGLLFASLLNDYYDYVLLGERNAIGEALTQKKYTPRTTQFLIWTPWIVALGFFVLLAQFSVTPISFILPWIGFILSWTYSAPPLRLKRRRVLGFVVPPVGIFLLFLQGFVLLRMPSEYGWLVAMMVFLFAWYLEFMHIADDSLQAHEIHKMATEQAIVWLKRVAMAGMVASIIAGFYYPVLFASFVAWTLRYRALRKISGTTIIKARRSILYPIWQLEDFALYAALGILNAIY